MRPMDLTAYGVIALADVEAAAREGAREILTRERVVLTPSAREAAERHGIVFRAVGSGASAAASAQPPAPQAAAPPPSRAVRDLFTSPEAEAVKAEIVRVGRKLWHRQYVDGNGGNISYRIGPNEVICTPTLRSKADLAPEDLCLVDLEGNELLRGPYPRTSEIFLHLEIYKAQPKAKGVVHCHPPHATAYALVGRVPPSGAVPEFDVFVGKVACTQYETPGTKAFAETVLPFVLNYNTVLLGNHGIVCWADTVTHAEWYAEVLETYCWTLTIASQLGVPFSKIPAEKEQDLLKIRQRLGLPDPRFNPEACRAAEIAEGEPGEIAVAPPPACVYEPARPGQADIESLVRDVTSAVMAALRERGLTA